jgi:predicted transcriptional regulator
MTSKKEYRSKVHIYLDVLRTIRLEGGRSGPTKILYGANLSHDRLTKYLSQLIELGFVTESKEEDKTYYLLTDKGIDFLREFGKIERFAEAFGIGI